MCFPYGIVSSYSSSGGLVSLSRTMTSAELTALSNEYHNDPTARGYSGKTAAQIAVLMNSVYSIPNPIGQPYLTQMHKEDFMHQIVSPLLHAIESSSASSTIIAQSINLIQNYMSILTQINMVMLNDPNIGYIISQLVVNGVITSTEATTISQILDPSWNSTIIQIPRAGSISPLQSNIFDIPLIVEGADVTTATGVS